MTAHKHAFKEEINHSKNDLKVETQHIMPAVSSSLQDVDMRMQPETVPHADMLDKDRPFYDQDMKDIDWRHIPFSDNQEHDKSVSRVFEGGVSKDDTMWSEEDIKTVKFLDDRQNMVCFMILLFIPWKNLHNYSIWSESLVQIISITKYFYFYYH